MIINPINILSITILVTSCLISGTKKHPVFLECLPFCVLYVRLTVFYSLYLCLYSYNSSLSRKFSSHSSSMVLSSSKLKKNTIKNEIVNIISRIVMIIFLPHPQRCTGLARRYISHILGTRFLLPARTPMLLSGLKM